MVEQNNLITLRLLELMQKTGYAIEQHNGQRRYGPPPDWIGPPPPKGCEIFIGKLPRDIFEDELVPIFSAIGKIYELRLMMDFSGSNRGYAFVTYATRSHAAAAVKQLNGYEIKPGRRIGVVKSVDNCRLFVGCIPKTKTKEDLLQELSKHVTGLVDVILYKNSFDRNQNRGFAFVEFTSHRAAAMARRALVPGCVKLWDQEVTVDWAEPEPDIDDEMMAKVKVLYVRNFEIWTTPDIIQKAFEDAINEKVERVKKIYDYAFIHFYQREHAELAMAKLQHSNIDGSIIEISWAKPVDRDLYRIQKMNRGNAKFNNSLDHAQTLMLYKQHVEKKEYAYSSSKDEGIDSAGPGASSSNSPNQSTPPYICTSNYSLAPAKLEAMCKRYCWAQPIYNYQTYVDPTGVVLWVCSLDLPQVGPPLVSLTRRIGPVMSRACYSFQQATVEAAENVLQSLKAVKTDMIPQPMLVPPVYSTLPPVQNCTRSPYEYPSIYPPPQSLMPFTIPTIWRTI